MGRLRRVARAIAAKMRSKRAGGSADTTAGKTINQTASGSGDNVAGNVVRNQNQQGVIVNDEGTSNIGTIINNFDSQPKVTDPTGRVNNLGQRGILDPSRFVGRGDELRELEEKLGDRSVVAIAGVVGMGGVGKSELAVQFARQLGTAEKFPGGVIWLSGARLLLDLVGVAEEAFLTPADMERLGTLDTEEQQARFCWSRWPSASVSPLTKGGLRGDPSESTPSTNSGVEAGEGGSPLGPPLVRGEEEDGRVLVVVDDITEFKCSVKPLLPGDDRFKILLTTRDRRLLPKENCLFLDVLTGERALALLGQFVGEERLGRERDLAVALVERLGRLPLAVELVGAYLQEDEDLSLARLLGRLEEKGLGAAALREVPEVVQAEGGVAAAFELSWEWLSEGARRLAVLLGCFGLAPVPWELVRYCLPEEEEEQLDHWRTRELQRFCLLERRDQGLYKLHPLIWEFFGQKWAIQEDGKQLQQAFLKMMVNLAKTVPQVPTLEMQNRIRIAVPHLEQAARFTAQIDKDDCTRPAKALSCLAEAQSLWTQAEWWSQAALEVSKQRFGANHPNTGMSLNDLALLYESQGRYSEAEPLYGRSLQISESHQGSDHPNTAASLNNLAALYQRQGRYSEAEPLLRQSLVIFKSRLGVNHPDTATSMNNLALLYFSQGRYSEAEPLFRQSVAIHESQLGADDPITVQGVNNLAELYRSQERYSEAEPLHKRVLKIRRSQLGEDHPSTAQSVNNLALLYFSQGRHSEAETLYQRSLAIHERQLGADHPSTAQSVNNLAALYRSQGRYSEAEPLYERALAIRKSQLEANHPDTASSLSDLATIYANKKLWRKAESSMVQALVIWSQTLGQDHPYTQGSIRGIASIIAAAMEQGHTADLSDHPLTQSILQQLQQQNPN